MMLWGSGTATTRLAGALTLLQRRHGGHRDHGGLLEREVARLPSQLVLPGRRVLGERAVRAAIPYTSSPTDSDNRPGDISAGHRVLGPAKPESESK